MILGPHEDRITDTHTHTLNLILTLTLNPLEIAFDLLGTNKMSPVGQIFVPTSIVKHIHAHTQSLTQTHAPSVLSHSEVTHTDVSTHTL